MSSSPSGSMVNSDGASGTVASSSPPHGRSRSAGWGARATAGPILGHCVKGQLVPPMRARDHRARRPSRCIRWSPPCRRPCSGQAAPGVELELVLATGRQRQRRRVPIERCGRRGGSTSSDAGVPCSPVDTRRYAGHEFGVAESRVAVAGERSSAQVRPTGYRRCGRRRWPSHPISARNAAATRRSGVESAGAGAGAPTTATGPTSA